MANKPVPTDPKKWAAAKRKAKSKYKVWPSAYSSAYAAKEYRKMGGSWRGGNNKVKSRAKKKS